MRTRGLLVVLSGPAGSGKSSLADALIERMPDACRAVTATTRQPRSGEIDGEDYFFLTRDEFESGLGSGRFVEHNEFNGNLYGTPKDGLETLLSQDKIIFLVIDVNGAKAIRESFAHAVLIFLLPPSPEELRARLCGRGTECAADVENRLAIAREEVQYLEAYDFLVINDAFDTAVEDLRSIVTALRHHHIRGGEREAWERGAYTGWHATDDDA